MPIEDKGNGITEVRARYDDKLLWMLPTQMLADLRDTAFRDGVEQAGNDKWLLGEIRYAGEPLPEGRAKCWNCGDTLALLAPTGDVDRGRAHFRPDGARSPISRKWRLYPCPACQNPKQRILSALAMAGIPDPEATLLRQIDWKMPGREEMGGGVRAFTGKLLSADTAGMLVLVGAFGVGKSVLAEYIVAECAKASRDALYVTAERFKRAVGDSVGGDEAATGYLQRVRSAAVVAIDQIDWIRETTTGGQPSYTADVFRDVLDARYQLRRTHATIFTVNLKAWTEGSDGPLAAIYDRMREAEVYTMFDRGIRGHVVGINDRDYGEAA